MLDDLLLYSLLYFGIFRLQGKKITKLKAIRPWTLNRVWMQMCFFAQ